MKKNGRLLAWLLVFAMVIGFIPPVKHVKAAAFDAVNQEWKISSTNPTTEKSEVVTDDSGTWRRFVSSPENDNGKNAAVFTNETIGDSLDHSYEFVIKPNSSSETTRFGFFLRYKNLSQTVFVGYDKAGWFYQLYNGEDNPWYTGDRIAAPEKGVETKVNISLSGSDLNVLIDGVNAFGGKVDVPQGLTQVGKLAIKAGTYEGELTDVLIKGSKSTGDFTETVEVEKEQDEQPEEPNNLVNGWKISSPNAQNEVLESQEKNGKSYTRFVAGQGNDNQKNPGVFTNEKLGEVKDGEFNFTISPNTEAAKTRAGFYLRYNGINSTIFVGYDTAGWFWQLYDGVKNPWYNGQRIAGPERNQTTNVSINLSGDQMTVSIDGQDAFGTVDVSSVSQAGKVGVKAGGYGQEYSDIALENKEILVTEKVTLAGKVTDEEGQAIKDVKVKAFDKETLTDEEGAYTLEEVSKTKQKLVFEHPAYEAKEVEYLGDDETNIDVQLVKKAEVNADQLTNDTMEVTINKDFPQVVQYKMLKEDNKIFEGQRQVLDTITINGVDYQPEVEYTKVNDTKARYILENLNGDLKFRLTYDLSIKDNSLELKLVKVENLNASQQSNNDIVRTIEFRQHSLVSVNTNQENPNLMGGKVNVNTRTKAGDQRIDLDKNTRAQSNAHSIAVISNDELSATIYSNTETNSLGDWNNTVSEVYKEGSVNHLSLRSAEWVYQKGLAYKPADSEALNSLPVVRVAITGDRNNDGQINWNDGAVAYRDIAWKRPGGSLVPETVATRIAMNFGSQAQNPFLVTLDNVKKVYLHTDGLGQNVLLKGYGSEGHDSGHLNYADIGKRIGGAKDMKLLLDEGEKYGAIFGIHVNASETYPESKYFTEDRLKRKDGNYHYGWNWIDQGININADYDLRHGRAQRWADLAKELDRGDGTNGLDYIYVDVWGNGQSGDNGTWASQQLAKEIMSQGWSVAGEWGYANHYTSIFQHWAADLTYGGYSLKGVNSKLIRFVENHERDAWVANYPSYSGAALNPLLGGYNMKDFEGWQGRNSYSSYMTNLYRNNLSSKFIQHFKVNKWVDGHSTNLPEAPAWIPEMEVGGINEGINKSINIKRLANDYNKDQAGYRTRKMYLEDKHIFTETASDVNYLIPWYWDQNGKILGSSDQKLYHFNTQEGTTTWDLPSEFAGQSSLVMYELTDTGKKNEKVLPVSNGQVTITAKANTPYVLFKEAKTNKNVTWSEYAHITDTGFNARNLDAWTVEGNENSKTEIVDTATGTQVLEISNNENKTTLSQKIKDLKPGQKYAVYVGVENRSDTKAFIELKDSKGNQIDYNYTNRSIALNFVQAYAHNTNNQSYTVKESNPFPNRTPGTSYFQNMYVFFTAPSDGSEVTLTIGKEAGEGTTYFDDIRVFENEMNNYPDDDKTFVQDFENSPQGLYPFVNGGAEFVQDNRIHLSEYNAPYTQKGWHVKKVSDVISGKWSLKVNGLTQKNHLLYQTVPQNYRFEPGKAYEVTLDYLVGSNGTYKFVLGDGKYYDNFNEFIASYDLTETVSNKEGEEANQLKVEFTVPEDSDGNYWIGMFSTNKAPDTRGVTGGDATFGGYRDLIIDNLVIKEKDSKDELDLDELNKAIETAKEELAKYTYTEESRKALENQIENTKSIVENPLTTQAHIDEHTNKIKALTEALEIDVPNKKDLQKAISESDAILQSEDYNDEAKELIKPVLEEVSKVNLNDEASLEDINAATEKLQKAILDAKRANGFTKEYEQEERLNPDKITAIATTGDAPFDGGATMDKLVDGQRSTFWHNNWQSNNGMPQSVDMKFDEKVKLTGFNYVARQNGTNGDIRAYKLYTSEDGKTWTEVNKGEFRNNGNKLNNKNANLVQFAKPIETQYLRFEATRSFGDEQDKFASGAELELAYLAKKFEFTENNPELDIVDKTPLAEAIREALKVKTDQFTEESVENLNKQVEEVKKVLADPNAKQEDVDKAVEAVKAEIDKLAKLEEEPGETPEEPGETPEEPGETPEEPGENPEEPGETPEEPGENPEQPGENPEEPGETPQEPGETPQESGETSKNIEMVAKDIDGNGLLNKESLEFLKGRVLEFKDIYFRNSKTKEVVDVEDEMKVTVEVNYTKDLKVYHIEEDGSLTRVKHISIDGNKVTFTFDRFSPFVFSTAKADGQTKPAGQIKPAGKVKPGVKASDLTPKPAPKTGDVFIEMFMIATVLAAVAIFVAKKRKEDYHK